MSRLYLVTGACLLVVGVSLLLFHVYFWIAHVESLAAWPMALGLVVVGGWLVWEGVRRRG